MDENKQNLWVCEIVRQRSASRRISRPQAPEEGFRVGGDAIKNENLPGRIIRRK